MSHEFIAPYEGLSHDSELKGGSSGISNQRHMKSKTIKVAYSGQMRKAESPWSGFREVFFPKIQIQGKWLDELGFHIGDRLTVEYEKDAIHIRSAEPQACMVSEATDYQTSGTGVGEKSAGIMDGGN